VTTAINIACCKLLRAFGMYICTVVLPYLTFRVGRLFHLHSTEAVSVRPNARPQKVKVTEGYVDGCETVNNSCEAVKL